jgi:hypothetical protein
MKSNDITVIGFVPDGAGGYRPLEDMTPEERRDFGTRLAQRMGKALNDYYSVHPAEYARI